MALSAARIALGDRHEAVVVDDLSRTQLVMYAGASGDFQPLHTDEVFARAMGFEGTFAHGMLTMALAGKALTDFAGADRLVRYRARFLAQVWPGATLTTAITVAAVRRDALEADLELVTHDQDGVAVLSGSATVRLAP